MAANQNVVDGEVEVLDLEELEAALGGAARRPVAFPPAGTPAIKRPNPAEIFGDLKKPAPIGPLVLIENDGWQGGAFEPLLTPTIGFR